jgi:hypothetical protein
LVSVAMVALNRRMVGDLGSNGAQTLADDAGIVSRERYR